jgi:hypothetical protein
MGMITRQPIDSHMLQRAAIALYDRTREIEGRVPWEDAASWTQEAWEQQARIALEAAIPQEDEFLRLFAQNCISTANIL